MSKTTKEKKSSEYIEEFLNFLSDVKSKYNFAFDEVNQQDKLTQDYLHSIELDNLKYEERNKIATKLVINRKDRRYYKDIVEEYEPIVEFLDDSNNKKIINQLTQVLGKVRKQEERHKNRVYIPRVLKGEKNEINF